MEKNYFNSEIRKANEEYMNVEGFMEFSDEGENFAGQEDMNAAGHAHKAHHPVADPIIMSIANTTTNNITSLEILYASRRLASNATAGVDFESGIPNITYTQMLNSIIFSPFTVGLTRLISPTTNPAQIQAVFTIATYTMSGAFAGKPQIPIYDSYQYQQGQIDIHSPYMLNGNTSFLLSTLYASNTLVVQFWPSAMVNQLGTLGKGQNVRNYARPIVNPALGR